MYDRIIIESIITAINHNNINSIKIKEIGKR